MNYDTERLYSLLPTIYRLRDTEQGKPLKALLAVLVEQINVLEEDLAQLYDDQFIETSAEWVVPYIGDLIGYQPLYGVTPTISSPRAEVANTIGFRRRKGTATMLEQLARDVTGWDARVVEFFQLLATTQYLNHLRPENRSTASLRDVAALERVGTPFDRLAHNADVRQIASGRGRYSIPNVGIFLWRLKSYRVTLGTARRLADGCYTCHPLGLDVSLFNEPAAEETITHLAEPINVPEPLGRRVLHAETEAQRQALVDGLAEQEINQRSSYFGQPPVLQIRVTSGGVAQIIPSAEILICDLSGPPSVWRRPPTSKDYTPRPTSANPSPAPQPRPISVALDPALGRLAFPSGITPQQVEVSYSYSFSADVGGGPYERDEITADVRVPLDAPTIGQAFAALGGAGGLIELSDSQTFTGDLSFAAIAGTTFTLRAKNGARPVIDGAITITSAPNATVMLDGLLVAGGVTINGTDAMTLVLRDCTLAPWLELDVGQPRPPVAPSVLWEASSTTDESRGTLLLDRVISGRIVAGEGLRVELRDSILDALGDSNVALAASADGTMATGVVSVIRSTIFGQIRAREIDLVENSIVTGTLTSARRQQGCVRLSYITPDSQTARQFHCQPALAVQQIVADTKKTQPLTQAQEDALAAEIQGRVEPSFTSRQYGAPAYAQVRLNCPPELRTGADDGAEMGAFHNLFQPQRETNLRVRLNEYLRFGLEAGILYVT